MGFEFTDKDRGFNEIQRNVKRGTAIAVPRPGLMSSVPK